MKNSVLFLLLVFYTGILHGNDYRGADLIFSINGFQVDFTLTTYQNQNAIAPDSIELSDGNGSSIYMHQTAYSIQFGVLMTEYTGSVTYPGPGTYVVTVTGLTHRLPGICNIAQSGNVGMSLSTTLSLSPFVTYQPPTFQNGHFIGHTSGDTLFHVTDTYDPDGDSLSFSLIRCLDHNGYLMSTSVYSFPSALGGYESISDDGILSVVPGPTSSCPIAMNIIVQKWRNGIFLCTIQRDILLSLAPVSNDEIPSAPEDFMLFPNPSTGMIQVNLPEDRGNETRNTFVVYTCDGKLVYTGELALNGNTFNIDLSSLPAGYYFCGIGNAIRSARMKPLIIY